MTMPDSLANHLWQSTLFLAVVASLTLALQTQPGAGALLALAGGVAEISRALRGPRRAREPAPVAVVRDDPLVADDRGDRRDEPAVLTISAWCRGLANLDRAGASGRRSPLFSWRSGSRDAPCCS